MVTEVIDTLISGGAHRYEFKQNGTGCRAWVSTQLDLLLSRRIIISNEKVAEVKGAQPPRAILTRCIMGCTIKAGKVLQAVISLVLACEQFIGDILLPLSSQLNSHMPV